MTEEDLEAWRANLVTERLLNAMRRLAQVRKDQILQAFWWGQEVDQRVLCRAQEAETLADDLLSATWNDIEQWEEAIDEYERNQADQL